MAQQEQSPEVVERRKSPRRPVSVPTSIRIVAPETTVPFEVQNASISDANEEGAGLSITVETQASELDLSKILAHGRDCHLACRIPGCNHASSLLGTIVWAVPAQTSEGIVVRMGIDLNGTDPSELSELRAFVASQSGEGATT